MRTRVIVILILFSLILSACSQPAAPVEIPTEIPAVPSETPMIIAPTEEPSNAVNSIEGAKAATIDRKSTRLNSSHSQQSRMPSSA